jgi:uncharacterized protein DUF5658
MPRTVSAVAFATMAFVTTPAFASDQFDPSAATPLAAATVLATDVAAAAAVEAITPAVDDAVVVDRTKGFAGSRPSALVPMYASYVALQGYDFYSTRKGLSMGATEANPVLKGVVGNPTAFMAVKGATTFASIYFAEKLWRSNKRLAAVALMAASNGLMAVVAANNASVLRRQGR